MARFTNATINAALGHLRTDIRDGKAIVYFKDQGVPHLKRLIVAYLFENTIEVSDALSSEYFNPQTLRRFDKLFDVPSYLGDFGTSTVYPTQDDTAKAIQNFMNRRIDPWAHIRPSTEVLNEAASVNV